MDLSIALDPTAIGDAGVPAGSELLAFVNAAQRLTPERPQARQALEAVVGPNGVLEAAATVAVFNGLVRVADGTGIQVDAGVLGDSADFRHALGVDRFAGAANTTTPARTVDRRSVGELFS